MSRHLGYILRTDGTREDISYSRTATRSGRNVVNTDFRTSDGEPLIMQPGDEMTLTYRDDGVTRR